MAAFSALPLLSAATFVGLTTIVLRFLYILPITSQWRRRSKPKSAPSHVVVVLGSGGHTREMLGLLRIIDPRVYTHRTYIASSGDNFAKDRAREIERNIQSTSTGGIDTGNHADRSEATESSAEGMATSGTGLWDFKVVPRARKIHQSILTTPFSAAQCLFGCVKALNDAAKASTVGPGQYPDVIVTNGPATAVMVILASLFLRFFGIAPVWKMKIIYVESWARVKRLSLSGKLLLHAGVCDAYIVQWRNLADSINGNGNGKRKRVEYMECIVK